MQITTLTQAIPQPLSRFRTRVAVGLLSIAVLPFLLVTPASAEDVVEVVITDALGNIRVITDDKGNVLERHDYLPFGEECTTGPCATNPGVGGGQPRKFTGKERDEETGLDYFGARYYRANTGRFTTVDPVYTWNENLLDPQRWNRCAYARNNPLRYVDPNGEQVAEAIRQWGQQAKGLPNQRAVLIGGALIIVATSIDKVADIGKRIVDSGALNATQPGYAGVDPGLDQAMTTHMAEGIYEFPDKGMPGRIYVG
jgi:RHS repeat-associated protein